MIYLIVFTIIIGFCVILFEEDLRNIYSAIFRSQSHQDVSDLDLITRRKMSIICTICQELLTEKPEGLSNTDELLLIATSCGHLYHSYCMHNWFASHGRHECPVCKSPIEERNFLSIYPSGDELCGEIAAKIRKANADSEENTVLKGELNQLSMILEDVGQSMQEEKKEHDELKYKFAQTLSEIDELRRQIDEHHKLKESSERNWMELMDKTSLERDNASDSVRRLEELLKNQILEVDKCNEKIDQLCLRNAELHLLNDMQSKQLEEFKNVPRSDLESTSNTKDSVEIGCQTPDKDLLALRSRWLMFKTCMKHMENEMILVENECFDIEKRAFDSTEGKNSLGQSYDVSLDLKEEIQNHVKLSHSFDENQIEQESCKNNCLTMEDFVNIYGGLFLAETEG